MFEIEDLLLLNSILNSINNIMQGNPDIVRHCSLSDEFKADLYPYIRIKNFYLKISLMVNTHVPRLTLLIPLVSFLQSSHLAASCNKCLLKTHISALLYKEI